MTHTIRPANLTDIDAMARIHVSSWQAAYQDLMPASYIAQFSYERRHNMWRKVVSQQLADVLVAERDGAIKGFLCVHQLRGDSSGTIAEINTLYVCPTHFSQGAGSALMHACEQWLNTTRYQSIEISVLDSNTRGIAFYRRHGFVATGKQDEEQVEGMTLCDISMRKVI